MHRFVSNWVGGRVQGRSISDWYSVRIWSLQAKPSSVHAESGCAGKSTACCSCEIAAVFGCFETQNTYVLVCMIRDASWLHFTLVDRRCRTSSSAKAHTRKREQYIATVANTINSHLPMPPANSMPQLCGGVGETQSVSAGASDSCFCQTLVFPASSGGPLVKGKL